MAVSLRGIHVPHRKHTANMSPVRMTDVKSVTIPMVMHIGKPATPVVAAGDHVDVGTLIAEQNGFISSPVYASVSGTVKQVADMVLSNGSSAPAVTIESDGAMTPDPSIAPPVIHSREDMLEALKKSGMVGLGGAGFPTYAKFATDKKIEVLVINGAECEPYITSDSITMVEKADYIARAIEALDAWFAFDKVIIGIEKNKPEAVVKMKELAAKNSKVSVAELPSIYPQGGEKVLVYHTTGRVIKQGQLPIDAGCVVCNSSTMANIGMYLETGMPLVERTITVDGAAVKEPKNVIVPIGTALGEVFEFCGGFTHDPDKVLYGGPMMGIAVAGLDAPVLKQTNAILALNKDETKTPKTTACIHCGACVRHCPFGINVPAISRGYDSGNMEMAIKAGVELCMECGCCSFGCPANRPLVQTNKLAKAALREYKQKEANA